MSDAASAPLTPQQIRVHSSHRCDECGFPLVWTEAWQGWDCVICVRNDRDSQALALTQQQQEIERLQQAYAFQQCETLNLEKQIAALTAERDALLELLEADEVYVSDGRVMANTNTDDMRGADAAEIPMAELPRIAVLNRAHPGWGIVAWVSQRIGVEPLPDIASKPEYQAAKVALKEIDTL